jgi:hypothetical protein
MSYQPIENCGIIGNMRRVALVGMNGAIDWYCYPLGRQWHHLLDRPDVLSDCPVGENRAIGLRLLIQQAIMMLLQYINGTQELLERYPV